MLKKIVESDKRTIKHLEKIAIKVEGYAEAMEKLSDEELKAKTPEFKARLEKGETLDDLLVEAFAVCREAARRVLGLFPYRVQIMGGIVLHQGDVPEMRTGEGKTLTLTMPVYLNALEGKGVHVVTVNEYLSSRDANEMGELYNWLGMTVGLNTSSKSAEEKREAYACDITYTTNNELGFDYLRDNMVVYAKQMVQRPLNFAVVDEVDSILIDEARTPLIISGQAEQSTALYTRVDTFVKSITEEDYVVDVQSKTIGLTETGIDKAEQFFRLENLYDVENTAITHHLDQSLRANYIMELDKDYVIQEGKVLIVDQFTGRIMDGRRYSDGLHQAIEAKEGVEIEDESKTMATITFQNYFRMYNKLSGTTGTGKTEEEEFREIYNMLITPIPTNKPIARLDHPDLLYPNMRAKFRAVVQDIKERHRQGQPVLVGTVAVETSEYLSGLLNQENIPHEVLNAKNHFKEADIILNAGQKGAVTIATNMAGRGTDIKLGLGVRELGGLAVIGTERHESRRIDNQLRGRSGRQGDPGESQFYLSLEDDLMRRFGSERIQRMLSAMKIEEDDAVIQSKMLTRQVESAQKRVEGNNYDTRKNVLQYDDVMREQREVIYKQRYDVITTTDDLGEYILSMIERTIGRVVGSHTMDEDSKNWNLAGIVTFVEGNIAPEGTITEESLKGKKPEQMTEQIFAVAKGIYERQMSNLPSPEQVIEFQKVVILRVVDNKWTDHIDAMDQLRQSIGLRAYGQNNPLVEYQTEGYKMFEDMVSSIEFEVTRLISKAQIHQQVQREQVAQGHATRPDLEQGQGVVSADQTRKPINNQDSQFANVGRNDLCPCGSGKKFKNCHGK